MDSILNDSTTLIALLRRRRRRKRQVRRWYVRPLNLTPNETGEYAILVRDLQAMDEELYFRYFRMNHARFGFLLGLVRDSLTHSSTHLLPIPPELYLAFTLHVLSTGQKLSHVALRYRIGKSTASKVFAETVKAIWFCLKEEYVPVPSVEDFKKIANDFWNLWNFPLCTGAIDGKHVRIKCPPNSGSLFYNYKSYFSILLMACVDAQYKFIMVDVGAYGSDGDPGTFANSAFGKSILRNTLPVPPDTCLPGTSVQLPHMFIADEAIQLRPNLMRPFLRAQLTDDTRIFNYRLSRARFVVEQAFGILAARWQIFLTFMSFSPETADFVIKACVSLHNFLRITDSSAPPNARYVPANFVDYEDDVGIRHDGGWREVTRAAGRDQGGGSLTATGRQSANMPAVGGKDVRDKLVRYFLSAEGSVPWQERSALSC